MTFPIWRRAGDWYQLTVVEDQVQVSCAYSVRRRAAAAFALDDGRPVPIARAAGTRLRIDHQLPRAVIALDDRDEVRWTARLPDGLSAARAAILGADAAIVSTAPTTSVFLRALDGASAAVRATPLRDLPVDDLDRTKVLPPYVITAPGDRSRLLVLDPRTGRTHETALPRRCAPAYAVAGDQVYVVTWSWRGLDAVMALDPVSDEMRWCQTGRFQPFIAAGDGFVATLSRGHSLVILDAVTGVERWRYGLPAARTELVAAGPVVLVTGCDELLAFDVRTPPTTERAIIRGRLTKVVDGTIAGRAISVGDVEVQADDRGRYTARVTAAGDVAIHGVDAGPFDAVTVTLDGRGDHVAPDLTIEPSRVRYRPHGPSEIVRYQPQVALADLHRHLDGSLRYWTLHDLAAARGITVPQTVRFRPGMGLTEALACFQLTLSVLQALDAIRAVAREACEDAAGDGVTTLELRFAPQLHGHPIEAVVDAALDGIAGRAGLILCALYGDDPDQVERLVEVGAARPGVVGVDLAGSPTPGQRWDLASYAPAFRRARDHDLGRTVHAGEGRPPAEIRAAIELLHAQRIGHGTTLLDDPAVLDLVLGREITIEACLTSNLHTGAIARIEDHPLARWLALGVRACVNTDNTLFSDCTAHSELARARGLPGMTDALLAAAIAHGHAGAFALRGHRPAR
ncbi:MAG: PQQ-binding-like beta-propeller repeat protein [Myxococcales bacterium]|nr:PQQ-binding-like beta-propeller repeat protein [Myxococcales bacterium]